MRVALTGASGFLGASLAQLLHSEGHEVVALVRATSKRDHIAPYVKRFVVGDHADRSIHGDLLEGSAGLIHNSVDYAALRAGSLDEHIESNVAGSIRLLEAAASRGVGRIVFMSSVAVHHEISPRWAGVVDEEHPLWPGSVYGAYKAAVEAHLWTLGPRFGTHTAALRPAAVYGVDPRLERSHGYQQVKRLLAGERIRASDFPGGGKWVHVEDVALAGVRALEREASRGRAFHLADCYAKFTRLGQLAAELLGAPEDRVELDASAPARNRFAKEAAREVLGVALDRGDAGLRDAMGALIKAIKAAQG